MVLIYSLEAAISAIGADAVCWIDPAFLGLTLSVLRVLLINSALQCGPFREGTCAPRRVGGQARYLNGYDYVDYGRSRFINRGNGIVSLTCSIPHIQAVHRSMPMPNPA